MRSEVGGELEPEWVRCSSCGRRRPGWQRRCRVRCCPEYSELWAGDQRQKVFAALKAYEAEVAETVQARVLLLTVTAPGEDGGLTWDETICAARGKHRHSGPAGCRVRSDAAEAFNDLAPKWWRRLHDEAAIATKRLVGVRPTLTVRVWERQRRGVLHVHPLLGYSTISERLAADVYKLELAKRAARHGFGFVDRKGEISHPRAAAAYLSSYFVSGKKGKLTLRESVTAQKMPKSIIHVSVLLTQASGVTMRSLRHKRYLWRVWGEAALRFVLAQGFTLQELIRADRAGISTGQLMRGYIQANAP